MEQILIGSFLGVSVIDDLKNRKVHNLLVLSYLVISSIYILSLGNVAELHWKSAAILSLCSLPLVYLRILGAGDYKLMLVVSVFLEPSQLYSLMFLSLFWNALAGVIKFGVNKITKLQTDKEALRFPFTVGILLAWMSLFFIPEGVTPW